MEKFEQYSKHEQKHIKKSVYGGIKANYMLSF